MKMTIQELRSPLLFRSYQFMVPHNVNNLISFCRGQSLIAFKYLLTSYILSFTSDSSLLHHDPFLGYGRQEVAELLINAGAKLDALNGAKQMPLDVAKLNREVRSQLGVQLSKFCKKI